MSVDEGGLSRREHDQMRDVVVAGARRIRPTRTHRMEFVAAGVALLLVGAVAGGVITAAIRQGDQAKPISTGDSRLIPRSNGWVAFGMGSPDSDLGLVGQGSPARRLVGSDADGLDQLCPAFSPDGSQLAFGEATGSAADGYRDAALVTVDVSPEGALSTNARTIRLDDLAVPPCPIWSPDGRWVAFGAETHPRTEFPTSVDQVWLVDTRSDSIRRLTGLSATDIDWAPDSSELLIASDDVLAYSVLTGETISVGEMPDAIAIAVSPDGTIAVERRPDSNLFSQLWLMAADGSDQREVVEAYGEMHGIGPVWSPDGSRLVFQRTCSGWVDGTGRGHGCREQHEVVVVTLRDGDPLGPPGTQTVIPPPYTTTGGAPSTWFPWSVTWSPDATTLLYLAWAEADGAPGPVEEPAVELTGLIAVPIVGSDPPVTLYEGVDVGVYSGYPWNTFQSWQSR